MIGFIEIRKLQGKNHLQCYCSFIQTKRDVQQLFAAFADNSYWPDIVGYTPFELDIGSRPLWYLANICFNHSKKATSIEVLRSVPTSLQGDFKFINKVAQARQSAYNPQNCRPHTYYDCDFTWLNKQYFSEAPYKLQMSQKLSTNRFSLFRIPKLFTSIYWPTGVFLGR